MNSCINLDGHHRYNRYFWTDALYILFIYLFIYYLSTSTFIFYYQFVVVEKLINNKEELTIVLFLKLNWMQVVSLGLGLPFSFRKDEKNKMTRLGDVQDTNHTVIHTYMYTPHIRLFCANRRHCGNQLTYLSWLLSRPLPNSGVGDRV